MCGLVGMAGALTGKHDRIIKDLLIVDTLRGKDSTGLAAISSYSTNVAKQVGDPFQLFDTKQFDRAMQGISRVFIGHNRAATIGKVNRSNAHPFEFDNIIGAHNGTLRDRSGLEFGGEYEVDSEQLYHNINDFGVKDTMGNVTGAWALTWWDKDKQTLNMLRNSERPLVYAFNKSRTQLYWASEEWMLWVACGRGEVDIEQPVELPEDFHLSFHIPLVGAITRIETPKGVTVKGKKPFVAPAKTVSDSSQTGSGKTVATKSNVTQINSTLVGKNLKFKGIDLRKDIAGTQFLNCTLIGNPNPEFRLYSANGVDVSIFKGQTFEGTVSRLISRSVAAEAPPRVFYKISPHGILMDIPEEAPQKKKGAIVQHQFDSTDHNGKKLSMKEWSDRYGVCANCNDDIGFGFAGKIVDHNTALCPCCVSSLNVH